ncbi:MAG: lysoplasmalogenase, partial [Chloroflexi bacterium]|nr:lysoplasmalogenase [Chloroflexota bacterium]
MEIATSVLVGLSAALELHGERTHQRRLIYLFKPLTTALMLLVALLPPWHSPAPYPLLIGLGLLASLAGDIFLMLPNDRFVPGLASFAAAHLIYTAAFALRARWGLHPEALIVLAALIALNGVSVVRRAGSLQLPVLVYLAVI